MPAIFLSVINRFDLITLSDYNSYMEYYHKHKTYRYDFYRMLSDKSIVSL